MHLTWNLGSSEDTNTTASSPQSSSSLLVGRVPAESSHKFPFQYKHVHICAVLLWPSLSLGNVLEGVPYQPLQQGIFFLSLYAVISSFCIFWPFPRTAFFGGAGYSVYFPMGFGYFSCGNVMRTCKGNCLWDVSACSLLWTLFSQFVIYLLTSFMVCFYFQSILIFI